MAQLLDESDLLPADATPPQPSTTPKPGTILTADDFAEPAPASATADPEPKAAAPRLLSEDDLVPKASSEPTTMPGVKPDDTPYLTRRETADLAEKYGVDPEFLRKAAGWWGGRAYKGVTGEMPGTPMESMVAGAGAIASPGNTRDVPDEDELSKLGERWKAAAGHGLSAVAMGIPQHLIRKAAEASGVLSKPESDSLVELEHLIEEKKGYFDKGADLVLGAVGPAGPSAKLAIRGAEALGAGAKLAHAVGGVAGGAELMAARGAAAAKSGEELEGAEHGAILGAVFGGLLGVGIGALGAAKEKLAKQAGEWIASKFAEAIPDAAVRIEERLAAHPEAEGMLRDQVLGTPERAAEGSERATGRAQGEKEFLTQTTPEQRKALVEQARAADPKLTDIEDRQLLDAAEEVAGVDRVDYDSHAWSLVLKARNDMRSVFRGGHEGAEAREGSDFVDRAWDAYRRGQALKAEVAQLPASQRDRLNPGVFSKAAIFVSDARYVYEAIDRRFGTELTPLLDLTSNRFNASTVAQAEAAATVDSLVKETRKVGIDHEQIYHALDSGDFTGLKPAETEIVQSWATAFKDSREAAEGFSKRFPELDLSPIRIKEKLVGPEQTYLPHAVVDPIKYVLRMEKRAASVGTDRLVERAAADPEGEAAELLRGYEIWAGTEIKTEAQLSEAMAALEHLDMGAAALQTRAGALFQREGSIPDFLRERDVAKLYMTWNHSMFRHLALRDSLLELSRTSAALADSSPVLSKYVEKHVRDLAGVRSGTLAGASSQAALRMQLSLERKAEAASNPITREAYIAAASTGDVLRYMSGQMYAYFLGARPDAALRNLTQPLFMSVPHLSIKDPVTSYGMWMEAQARATRKFGLGGMAGKSDAVAELRGRGLLPAEQAFEAGQWMSKGLEQGNRGAKWTREKLEGLSRWSMRIYAGADELNRLVSAELAHDLVHSLGRASATGTVTREAAVATDFVKGLPSGYRQLLLRDMRAGRIEEATHTAENFLTAATQYNYNRASMSEFGRSAGWLFSMFSKWPTSFLGEYMLSPFDRAVVKRVGGEAGARTAAEMPDEMKRLAWKYWAPLVLAAGAQAELGDKLQDSPRARLIAGSDLRRWAPGMSAVELASTAVPPLGRALGVRGGEGAVPPALGALAGAVGAGAGGDARGAVEQLGEFGISGAPGGVALRFLARDLDYWLGGDATDRSSTTSRLLDRAGWSK